LRILWLKTELLHPIDKGGKIRTYYMLRQLKRRHHITYLTLDDGNAAPDALERATEYSHRVLSVAFRPREKFSAGFYAELAANVFSPLPYVIARYRSEEMKRAIQLELASNDCDVAVCDFLTPSINLPASVPCATVLFQHNVEAMIWRRHYQVQRHPVKKAYLFGQWRKTAAYERDACRRFDQVVAVSADDRDVIRREYGVENVADVPTGVDTEYFRPSGKEPSQPNSLVFSGSMDWLPNEDAMQYFIDAILPRIRRAIPDVRLTVVGRNPYPRLLELARRDGSITVTGRVEDVRPYIERAAAFVVPLRIGGGTRLKLYEAMGMEKPVISTSIGAEGLPVHDGRELLLADSAEAFAESVIRVLTDPDLARRLARNAATLVRERFGWSRVTDTFAELCQRAIERRKVGGERRA
jgi:glycosyltransferase involved in cell wall biosynthesis